MSALDELVTTLTAGREWEGMGDGERARDLLWRVYDERCHRAGHHRDRYQVRVNLQKKADVASYAGFITAENPTSGPYQGTSFAWFPGEGGSIATLVIGTDGFGADTHILGRPGHARRLRALARLHRGRLWVKPDLLDLESRVPEPVSATWPAAESAVRTYGQVIYAAVAVRASDDAQPLVDLIDLFFSEHGTPLTGKANAAWEQRRRDMLGAIFPSVDDDQIHRLLLERRFLILEGPPGTGKTRLAEQLARRIGSSTTIQFHPARTYEDFVVGLFPRPTAQGLAFEVRKGDLLRANDEARSREHLLVIDEVNRGDLARVLGEAVTLFEVGESGRHVRLPHRPDGSESDELTLSPTLYVLGTRNTADRTIARMDVAIRRRFAFVDVWPQLDVVADEGVELATQAFADTIDTFAEFADEETLRLVPGHAYFLDPRPDLPPAGREDRVARRLQHELLPLLRDYVSERLGGGASDVIAGLHDRIDARLLGRAGR